MDSARGDRAGQRARRAAARADELTRRLADLRAGRSVDAGDVEAAASSAAASAAAARGAAEDVVAAFRSAAAAHRSAAECLQRRGQTARAREHGELALADDAAAAAAQRALDGR